MLIKFGVPIYSTSITKLTSSSKTYFDSLVAFSIIVLDIYFSPCNLTTFKKVVIIPITDKNTHNIKSLPALAYTIELIIIHSPINNPNLFINFQIAL